MTDKISDKWFISKNSSREVWEKIEEFCKSKKII